MVYIETIKNHKLGSFTESEDIAKDLGWTLTRGESEIEQSDLDWGWYEKGFAPMKSEAQKAEDLKAVKLREAEELLNAKLAEISAYPRAESESFEVQKSEAAAYLADNGIDKAEIPTITGISLGSQVELTELARKIVENAKDFAPVRGLYLGRYKRVRDLLNKAKTLAKVEAVDVAAIFEEAVENQTAAMFE
ncbi:MAG TPA: hypothetical protein DEB43_02165 [Desulfovibrio sp.]|nr:hypothetical protein [Desulfovibrio sp.]